MISFDKRAMQTLVYWITSREAIRVAKEVEKTPKPWTTDFYLRSYRWCNVRRMDDRVSQWLLKNWYGHGGDELVAATLARMINWPESLAAVAPFGFKQWNYSVALRALQSRKRAELKVFTGAYIINGAAGGDKIVQVLDTVDAMAKSKNVVDSNSMRTTWEALQKGFRGVGSFIAGQIVADMRFAMLGHWHDRMAWAPIGPGSRRGMRRMLGLPAPGPMTQAQFDKALPELWYQLLKTSFTVNEIFEERCCEAMDLQNCLCEFDKYVRLKYEHGHVRSGYDGGAAITQGKLI